VTGVTQTEAKDIDRTHTITHIKSPAAANNTRFLFCYLLSAVCYCLLTVMGGALAEVAQDGAGSKAGKLFREVYSTCLLIFCTVLIVAAIFTRQTTVAESTHPAVAFVILLLALIWLAMVEGSQAALVGLPPVDMDLYKDTHVVTYKIMTIVNKGDNIDRYLMGRQFLVLALVFIENICGDPIEDAKVLGMPDIVLNIFLGSGLALFFMTSMFSKISAQVNASRCMLDYVNTYFAFFTLYASIAIEASGLLHVCYLVQIFFAWASGMPLVSQEAPRSKAQNFFHWFRVFISFVILALCFAVTLSALFRGQTTMWDGVPPAVSVVLFFVFMAVVGMLEGMQIAFFAVARMTEAERAESAWAKKTTDVLFARGGRNLPGFMVGRQMCVTMCFFIVARVTTIKLDEGEENIFGVPDGLQKFFETGLLGALITTIIGSITWQLVASAFPKAFLSTPITYVLLRFCLFLEWTGLCQGAWVVALIQRKITKYQRDEVYIGTAEERAAKHMEDHDEKLAIGPGHVSYHIWLFSMSILDQLAAHIVIALFPDDQTSLVR
jgi:silicon transporter